MDSILERAKVLWDYHVCTSPVKKSDVIIGLGSYDTRVAEYCAQLQLDKIAPKLLFTGKSGNWTQDKWHKSEAEIFGDIALKQGVPSESLLLEKEATNIGENIKKSRELFQTLEMEVHSIILVTKPNTTRRALATCRSQWPEVNLIVSAPPLTFEQKVSKDHSVEALINEMVGDIQRIVTYPKLGFQIPQDIPNEVSEAYQYLVDNGFNQHLQTT